MASVIVNTDDDNEEEEKHKKINNTKIRKESVCNIEDLLRYIAPEEEYLFETYDDTSDISSDLSGPFSDCEGFMHCQEQEKKGEGDCLVDCTSSTYDFQKIEEIVRREMNLQLPINICSEDLRNIKVNLTEDIVDKELEEYAIEILGNCDIDSAIPNLLKEVKNEKETLSYTKKPNDYDSQSGLWRMLATQSNEDGFPISPIGYNIYEDEKLNWLKREDLDWNEKEKCKAKCGEWLDKYL